MTTQSKWEHFFYVVLNWKRYDAKFWDIETTLFYSFNSSLSLLQKLYFSAYLFNWSSWKDCCTEIKKIMIVHTRTMKLNRGLQKTFLSKIGFWPGSKLLSASSLNSSSYSAFTSTIFFQIQKLERSESINTVNHNF